MVDVVVIRQTRFEIHDCITCGVVFIVPEVVVQNQRKVGGFHHCSNGHRQGWFSDQSQDAIIRRERDSLRQKVAQKDDEIGAAWRAESEQRERAQKAEKEIKRIAKRAHNGVCPDCNRSFSNVARHIASKHPKPKLVCVSP